MKIVKDNNILEIELAVKALVNGNLDTARLHIKKIDEDDLKRQRKVKREYIKTKRKLMKKNQ